MDADLREIFRWCNDAFDRSEFASVPEKLRTVDVGLPGDLLVGWLSATLPASGQLGEARVQFVERVKPQLVKEFGVERTDRIYSRLA